MIDELFQLPIAHRGLHNQTSGIIENSHAAFERALTAGYGIECDLQLSGDEVPFVFHDQSLERLTGQKGTVRTLSAGQLQCIRLQGCAQKSTMMRFSQALTTVGGRVPFVIELKSQTDGRNAQLAQSAVSLAKNYRGPIAFKSFDRGLLAEVRKAGHIGALGLIIGQNEAKDAQETTSFFQRLRSSSLMTAGVKPDFISVDKTLLSASRAVFSKITRRPVMTWTVKSAEEEETARKGAKQIIFEGYFPKIG